MAGDTTGRGCPHDDVGLRPQMGKVRMSDDRVPATNIESPYGGGASSLPGVTGGPLPVKFPAAPVLLADEPQAKQNKFLLFYFHKISKFIHIKNLG